MLKSGGKFVLSIDKSQEDFIDMGTRKITIFPDSPTEIKDCILNADLDLVECFDTELAHIFVAKRLYKQTVRNYLVSEVRYGT